MNQNWGTGASFVLICIHLHAYEALHKIKETGKEENQRNGKRRKQKRGKERKTTKER
jgi:hypothetical protein